MSERDKPGPAEHLRGFRWAKGTSGNPGGRPRGTGIKAVLRRALAQKHNGKRLYDLLGDVILREALKGKPQLIRELLDRVEGPVAPAAASGPPVQALVINIVPAEPPPGRSVPLLSPGEGEGRENVRVIEPR